MNKQAPGVRCVEGDLGKLERTGARFSQLHGKGTSDHDLHQEEWLRSNLDIDGGL